MTISVPILAEQIQMLYTGGRPTVEGIDVRLIEKWVQQAFDSVLTEGFYKDYQAFNEHGVPSHYHVPLLIPIYLDEQFNGKSCILPEQYVVLPQDKGIVGVAKGNGYSDELTYIKHSEWNSLKSGGLLDFAGEYFYTPLNKKIIVRGNCPADKIPFSTIMVTIVAANDETLDDGMALAIIAKVMPLMDRQYGTRPDMISDQNPQPTR